MVTPNLLRSLLDEAKEPYAPPAMIDSEQTEWTVADDGAAPDCDVAALNAARPTYAELPATEMKNIPNLRRRNSNGQPGDFRRQNHRAVTPMGHRQHYAGKTPEQKLREELDKAR